MEFTVRPGPDDISVLTRQDTHRTECIWSGSDTGAIIARRGDVTTRREMPDVDRRIIDYLIQTDFYGLHCLSRIIFDHALITALVERWRPETHTFHFRVGEATVTLQDVEVLLGLPVDGDAVVYQGIYPSSRAGWAELSTRLLGVQTTEADIATGSSLEFTWLRARFSHLPEDATDHMVQCYTRAYQLLLMGGCLFADTSSSRVPLRYLLLLEDLGRVRQYSWGGACLAALYRQLCRATAPSTQQIAGPMLLLQVYILDCNTTFTYITFTRYI